MEKQDDKGDLNGGKIPSPFYKGKFWLNETGKLPRHCYVKYW